MKRAYVLWVAAAIAVILAFEAFPMFPVNWFGPSSGVPMVHSEREAEAAVRSALLVYGGLPRDAELTERSGEIAMVVEPGADLDPGPRRMSYLFRWAPRGQISGSDTLWAMVDDREIRTCEDPACKSYAITYELEVTSLQRRWTPTFVRALRAWWIRAHAPVAPQPTLVRALCNGGSVDLNAFRRVIGSADEYDPYLGAMSLHNPVPRRPGPSVLAYFAPYKQPLKKTFREQFMVKGALVSDYPGERRRSVMLLAWNTNEPLFGKRTRFAHYANLNRDAPYWWMHFESPDDEPVCPGAQSVESSAVHTITTRAPLARNDAVYRFLNEIVRQNSRTRFIGKPATRLIRRAADTAVELEWRTGDGAWRGRYRYDASDTLQEAEIRRP